MRDAGHPVDDVGKIMTNAYRTGEFWLDNIIFREVATSDPTYVIGAQASETMGPTVTNLSWETTGGFTDNTLIFGQILDIINATVTNTTSPTTGVYLTVTDPDSIEVVSNVSLSNYSATGYSYTTDITLNKAGVWNINVTGVNSDGQNSQDLDITVSIQVQSTKDGWYGYSQKSLLTPSQIAALLGYGYDIFELEDDMTTIQANFGTMLDSINNSRNANVKSAINIVLNFNYSDTALVTQYLTDITENFSSLAAVPYQDAIPYISLELENMGSYSNTTLDSIQNQFAQTITTATSNSFVIYSKNYNTTGLDSSYIQATPLLYFNSSDEETFIQDQKLAFKQQSSLNRIYTQIPTAVKVLAYSFQSAIIDNLRSIPDPGTLTETDAASLVNNDVIVFNNGSTNDYFFTTVDEPTKWLDEDWTTGELYENKTLKVGLNTITLVSSKNFEDTCTGYSYEFADIDISNCSSIGGYKYINISKNTAGFTIYQVFSCDGNVLANKTFGGLGICLKGPREIILNKTSANFTINVSELSVTGKDVWDSTLGWLLEINTDDVFTVEIPGYDAAVIYFEDLDHIEMDTLTVGTVYKADTPATE